MPACTRWSSRSNKPSRAPSAFSQIGHGNRSEKIRTYNQPQDRVTDHRIGFNSTYNGVLLGSNLADVIDALAAAERAEKLAQAV